MTREEALQILDTIPTISEQVDALEMAIKALSQEPCDDAISRKAAIEAVKQAIYNHDSAIMRLTELPSVTQKSGKWIKGKDEYGTNHFTCPFCGHDIATKAENWDDNYCANCGAKMESEDKE